jgi:hypothetical protein
LPQLISSWRAFALCLLAACIFWFFNAMNKHQYTDDISYPIEIAYDADMVVPISRVPSRIRLNATGEGWNFLRKAVGFNVVPVTFWPQGLPKRKFITAEELLAVAKKQIDGINVNYLLEDTIFLNFDYLSHKKVALKLDMKKLSLAPNYKIMDEIILKPDSIQFTGPLKMTRNLPDSIMLTLPYKNIKGKFNEEVKIDYAPEPSVRMNTNKVHVSFFTYLFFPESVTVNVHPLNFPSNNSVVLTKRQITLNYFVPEKDKDKTSAEDFDIFLDFTKVNPSDSTIKPMLMKRPDYIRDPYFSPASIKVRYVR